LDNQNNVTTGVSNGSMRFMYTSEILLLTAWSITYRTSGTQTINITAGTLTDNTSTTYILSSGSISSTLAVTLTGTGLPAIYTSGTVATDGIGFQIVFTSGATTKTFALNPGTQVLVEHSQRKMQLNILQSSSLFVGFFKNHNVSAAHSESTYLFFAGRLVGVELQGIMLDTGTNKVFGTVTLDITEFDATGYQVTMMYTG
jgi:hypothetical protein